MPSFQGVSQEYTCMSCRHVIVRGLLWQSPCPKCGEKVMIAGKTIFPDRDMTKQSAMFH